MPKKVFMTKVVSRYNQIGLNFPPPFVGSDF
jgi:hypothetical protein